MANQDFLSPEGLRLDGRRANEVRSVRCQLGDVCGSSTTDGSAYFELGRTKIIAYVQGPREGRRQRQTMQSEGVLVCEFNFAPFSQMDYRKVRKNDKQALELGLRLRKTFESVVMLEKYPRSEVVLCIHVIEADGGVCAAAVNAASLALLDAGVCMRDIVVGCTAGYLDLASLTDVNQTEVAGGLPMLTLAVEARTKLIVLCEMESKVTGEAFDEMSAACFEGCKEILECLQTAIRDAAVLIFSRAKSLQSTITTAAFEGDEIA